MKAMKSIRGRRVNVANDLNAVTRIASDEEASEALTGISSAGRERIWKAAENLYATGVHPAVTLLIRRHGEIALKRSIGCVSGNAPGESGPQIPLAPDAPQCLFSASKAITALLIHKLVEDGEIGLEHAVARYVPEFAAEGKGHITVEDLLTHRAGVPFIPQEFAEPSLLGDWERIVHLICAHPPFDKGDKTQAYHAITGGYIVGELVQRVAGISVQQALKEWIAEPLGCQFLHYGAPEEIRSQIPGNHVTGPPIVWPASTYLRRIVGIDFMEAVMESNGDLFMDSVMPAANIYASAEDANRVFEMLLRGGSFNGKQVLKPETVARAIQPRHKIAIDRSILLPMRYSAGFMLGEKLVGAFGPKCPQAFGHLGLVNILCWADPQRDISVSFINTGKSLAPDGTYHWFRLLATLNRECKDI